MDRKGARLLCAYRAGDVTNQSEIDSDAIPIDKAPLYLHFMAIARKLAAIGVKITSASLFLSGLRAGFVGFFPYPPHSLIPQSLGKAYKAYVGGYSGHAIGAIGAIGALSTTEHH